MANVTAEAMFDEKGKITVKFTRKSNLRYGGTKEETFLYHGNLPQEFYPEKDQVLRIKGGTPGMEGEYSIQPHGECFELKPEKSGSKTPVAVRLRKI